MIAGRYSTRPPAAPPWEGRNASAMLDGTGGFWLVAAAGPLGPEVVEELGSTGPFGASGAVDGVRCRLKPEVRGRTSCLGGPGRVSDWICARVRGPRRYEIVQRLSKSAGADSWALAIRKV